MVREQGRALGVGLAGHRLEKPTDAVVQLAALAEQQALVGDLLRQALAEAELVAGEQALAVDDAAFLERRELELDVDRLAGEELDELLAVELPAEHGGDLHDALRLRSEPVEARSDQLLDGPRHADLVDRTRETDLAVAPQQVSLLDQRPGDLLGEERVALGLLHDALLELVGERTARDARARPRPCPRPRGDRA